MANKIQIRRGMKKDLPQLSLAEFGFALDTGELFLGNGDGNKNITHRPKAATFVIGTTASGHTENDCDYLCDGTADDVEINAAIQALPSTGGKVLILEGTYQITKSISVNKPSVTLEGCGVNTQLKRMWNSGSSDKGVINMESNNGVIYNLSVDGNKSVYTNGSNACIFIKNNTTNNKIIGAICNNGYYGIYADYLSNHNVISANICSNNTNGIYINNNSEDIITDNICNANSAGIYLYFKCDNIVISNNICNDSAQYGIYLHNAAANCAITQNTCCSASYGIYSSSSDNCAIIANICNSNTNGIFVYGSCKCTVANNICDKNGGYGICLNGSDDNAINGNKCYDNTQGGLVLTDSSRNGIVGNVCLRGSGTSSDYTNTQYTIRLSSSGNSHNLIADNLIMGKNYVNGGGTGNTFVNNKYE